jgi:hypothetical protein
VVFAGAWLALLNAAGDWTSVWESDPERWQAHLTQVGLNPLAAWWLAGFSWDEGARLFAQPDQLVLARLAAVAAGSLLTAATAGVFWVDSLQRFRKL